MAIDFPNSPTLNQIYTSGDKSWKWDGTVWNSVTKTIQGDPGRFYTSDTAPTFPTLGDGWFNTTNGKMYVFYDNFWVDAAQSIFTSNVTDASTTASGLVNTTTQTFAGDKTFTGTVNSFATSAARAAALPSPVENSITQLVTTSTTDTANQIDFYNGSAWESIYTPGRNAIINGGFDFWQRTSTPTTGFSNPASGTYCADRWRLTYDGTGATHTVSAGVFGPGEQITGGQAPQQIYYHRWAVTTNGTGNSWRGLSQFIENVRTFAGQTVTVSFWAKADTSRTGSYVTLRQNFGSGGTAASVDTWSSSFALTASWAKYSVTLNVPSISGKSIGTGSTLELLLFLPANQTMTIDLWGVQLEAGSVATPFRRAGGTLAGELAACQRYYETGKAWGFVTKYSDAGTRGSNAIFKVSKRATPTMSVGSYATLATSTTEWYGYIVSVASGNESILTWTAEAEL